MDTQQLQALRDARASILGRSAAPAWLDSRLKQMVETIQSWRAIEALAPKRGDMKARLNAFRDAVETLKDGVSDPAFNVFLGHNWLPPNVLYVDIISCFDELSQRANRAGLRLAGKGGVAQAYPTEQNEAVTAMELCAWTVMHAMMFARGLDAIGPDNVDAQQAANNLWKAAGGAPLGSRDGSRQPTGWRDHFLSVKEAEQAGDRRSDGLRAMLATFQARVLVELD